MVSAKMTTIVSDLSQKDDEDALLLLASLFERDFSIDWIQAVAEVKATKIMKAFEGFVRDGHLKNHDIGVFSFVDSKKRQQLQAAIPINVQKNLRRRIANYFLKEIPDSEGILRAAAQLLHIENDLKGCEILYLAGDQYRRNGHSERALACYDKAIQELKTFESIEADELYVKTVIGYSKDHLAIEHITRVNSLLQEALERSEKLNNPLYKTQVLMHLASNNFISQKTDIAKVYFNRGYALAKDIEDPNVKRSMASAAIIRYGFTGRYKLAVQVFETYEPLFAKKYPMHKFSLRVAITIGLGYACLGQISQGLGLLDGIRLHSLKINDYETATIAGIDMGSILMLTHKFDDAINLISNTLAASKGQNQFARFFASYYLAYCYYQKGNVKKSRRFLIEALEIGKTKHYDIEALHYYVEICTAMELGHYQLLPGVSPKEEIQNSLNSKNIVVKAVAKRSLAMIDRHNKKPEECIEMLKQSLDLLEESGFAIELAKTKLELGRLLLQIGDREQATALVTAAKTILYPLDPQLIPTDIEHLVRDFRVEDNTLAEIIKLGQEAINHHDTREVVQNIFLAVNRITGAERGAIFIKVDESSASPVKLWAAKNLTADDLELPEFADSMNIIRQMMVERQPNIQVLSREANKCIENVHHFKSRIFAPLLLRGKIIGVLYHDNRFFESTFKEQNVNVLFFFASLTAIVLDNVKAYEQINKLNQRLYDETQYLKAQQLESFDTDNIVASSPAMKRVLSVVRQVAGTKTTVMILGETGVGKEIVAQAIQRYSSRCDKPYIRVNCSAFPQNLISSELFGHERGAFTGAVEQRMGRFELADGGTIFLDEIGEITHEVQLHLLRVLQTGEFERIGGRETLRSDFRLLVATNKNLSEEVVAGRFRADLYYRLNAFPIIIPSLRERREDIAALANFFLRLYSKKMGKSFKGIPEKEMAKLFSYHWPGNVRELENVIERGVIMNTGDLFQCPDLKASAASLSDASLFTIKEMERRLIIDALEKTNWKISGPGGAAELLDINSNTLYSRMKKLHIIKAKPWCIQIASAPG
jgi:formate hydrogenlyase transcriptional activator